MCSSYASSNGKRNTQPRRQTASSRDLPYTRLLLSSRGWWGCRAGRQQAPGAHLSMGMAFGAEMLLVSTEHTCNALNRDLPEPVLEQWYHVPHYSPDTLGLGRWRTVDDLIQARSSKACLLHSLLITTSKAEACFGFDN